MSKLLETMYEAAFAATMVVVGALLIALPFVYVGALLW
jgi:hypothetical protein